MIYFPEFDDSNEDKKLFLNEKIMELIFGILV